FVDQKMKEIANTENLGDTTRVALMAAFDIADQLLRERTQIRADRLRADEAIRRLEQHLDGVKKDGEAA
ncbi:MAG: cell division protein ZapA, partial [Candidatus Latescibacteria bacterium]|nr:cell division protein ZapA [Candidatus Latescibacterota bacterium]